MLLDEVIVGYIGRTQPGSDSERITPPTQPTICGRAYARFKLYSYAYTYQPHIRLHKIFHSIHYCGAHLGLPQLMRSEALMSTLVRSAVFA